MDFELGLGRGDMDVANAEWEMGGGGVNGGLTTHIHTYTEVRMYLDGLEYLEVENSLLRNFVFPVLEKGSFIFGSMAGSGSRSG